jgi:uroporphyrinogen decarboxylase
MRQAGRYMAEYRALREKHGFIELCRTPELATAVTLMPVRKFKFDAAILFSDLLVVLIAMGLPVEFGEQGGPIIARPLRAAKDIDDLRRIQVQGDLGYVLDAIRMIRSELSGRLPLIGFAGAPFTLAAYAIEGGHPHHLHRTKRLMYEQPAEWHRLASLLAENVRDFLKAQIAAGVDAVQLFDSWIGVLDASDYREFVLPHIQTIAAGLRGLNTPLIHFGTDTGHLLALQKEAGGDVIGVDWRTPLDEAYRILGEGAAVQGNLDPVLLFAPRERLLARVDEVLRHAAGRPGHVFNLGHGILPETPIENVQAVIDHVHERTTR